MYRSDGVLGHTLKEGNHAYPGHTAEYRGHHRRVVGDMKHWTRRRWASLIVHVAFVSVPFTLSTASALLFWRDMFQDWTLAIPMVAVIEVLALTGLILFLTRIESPFVSLRHLLPFISIIPLGRELYLLLAHNPAAVAWSLTALATGILVVIAWQCFRTIERLFIDPMDAAREQAHTQVAAFRLELAQHEEMSMIVDGFVRERMEYHRTITTLPPLALPSAAPVMPAATLSKTARVKAYSLANNVSESTVWRGLKDGTITIEEDT